MEMEIKSAINWLRKEKEKKATNLLYIVLAMQALEKQIPKSPTKSKWIGIKVIFYSLCPCCEINLCTEGLLPSKKK